MDVDTIHYKDKKQRFMLTTFNFSLSGYLSKFVKKPTLGGEHPTTHVQLVVFRNEARSRT